MGDHSGLLLGGSSPGSGNRTEIHHSVRSLTRGKWKLIDGGNILILPPWGNGMVQYSRWGDGWGFEAILNTLSFHDCGHGCLFDIHADPNERKDVSKENT